MGEDFNRIGSKAVPDVESGEDERPDSHRPEDVSDANGKYNEMELEEQKHSHEKENRIIKWGLWIVCGILAACLLITVFGACIGEEGLYREFFTISSTALTLIMGYLFGSKNNKG